MPASGIGHAFGTEAGFGAGLSCGRELRIGGTAELANINTARLWYYMGELRLLRTLGDGLRPFWLSVAGGAGLFVSRSKGVFILLPIIDGDDPETSSSGLALGSSARLGYSGRNDWSVFIDVALRLIFLETERFMDGESVGVESRPLWVFPITAGVQLGL